MTTLEGGRHYSPQTQNRKIPKCSSPAFCKLKEQHCVLRSDCIQILWFLFSYFPSLCAFCSTCSAVWEKCFVCFVLWVANWLGPSACVCPPRPWATPSCLRQCWLYSDLLVKFRLPPLHRLCCVVTRLCAVLMHTHKWLVRTWGTQQGLWVQAHVQNLDWACWGKPRQNQDVTAGFCWVKVRLWDGSWLTSALRHPCQY